MLGFWKKRELTMEDGDRLFRLDWGNAWRFDNLGGVVSMFVLWLALGVFIQYRTQSPLGWFLVLAFGGGLVVKWLCGYMRWLQQSADWVYDGRALALLPAPLQSDHSDEALQNELRHYGIELKVLRAELRSLKRQIGSAWLIWTPHHMRERLDRVLESMQFSVLTDMAQDLSRRRNELVARIEHADKTA